MTSLAADMGGTYSGLAWIDHNGRPQSALPSPADTGFNSPDDATERGPGRAHEDPACLPATDRRIRRAAPQQGLDAKTPTVINNSQPTAPAPFNLASADHAVLNRPPLQDAPSRLDSYRFLNADQHLQATPRDIVERGHQDNESTDEAIRLFVAVFAAYAGNMALAFHPTGAIVLCGSQDSHPVDWFEPADVASRDTDRGRIRGNVKHVPLFLASSHNAGIDGATTILNRNHRAEA